MKVTSKKDNIQVTRDFRSTKPLSSSQVQVYNHLNERLNELSEKFNVNQNILNEIQSFMTSLKPQYYVGEIMQKICEVEKIEILDDDNIKLEQSEFEWKFGQRFDLIEQTWFSITREILAKSQLMFEKNKEWASKNNWIII